MNDDINIDWCLFSQGIIMNDDINLDFMFILVGYSYERRH